MFCDLASLRNFIISLKFCWFYLFYQFICFSIRQVVVSIDFLFFSVCRYILNITNIFVLYLHISYSKDNQFPVTVSYATPNPKMKMLTMVISKICPALLLFLNSFTHINMIAISTHTTIYTKFPVTLEFVSFLIVYLILTYNLKLSFGFVQVRPAKLSNITFFLLFFIFLTFFAGLPLTQVDDKPIFVL